MEYADAVSKIIQRLGQLLELVLPALAVTVACRSLITKARSPPYDLFSETGPEVVQVTLKEPVAGYSGRSFSVALPIT